MTGIFLARWRSWLLGPGTLALVLGTSDVGAQISIDIDEAQRITFETGNFDIRRYSGEMQGVFYFVNDRLVMTADRIGLETAGPPEDGQFFVKSLEMINADITGEGLRFASAIARNIDFGALLAEHNLVRNADYGISVAGLFDNSFLQIRGIEINEEVAELTIGNVETLGFAFDQLPSGERYAKKAGISIDDLRFGLSNVEPEFGELVDLLTARGLRSAEFDLVVSQIAKIIGDELHAEHVLKFAMENMASFEMNTGIEVELGTLMVLNELAAQGLADEAEMIRFLRGIELAKLNATYIDTGLLEMFVEAAAEDSDVSMAEMLSGLRLQLAQTMEGLFPRNGRRLAGPIETLLKQGGGLEVSVRPQQPVMLSNFLGFLIMPDLALEQLGVTVTHLRRQ